MSQILEVKIPDIGDFHDIPVIEVMVKPGDVVKAEDSLITLESDKSTMDVPAPTAGVVKDVKVKVGDKVSKDTLVLLLEVTAVAQKVAAPAAPAPVKAVTPPTPAATASAPAPAGTYKGKVDVECEVLVLGAGPGGYSAAFRAADLGMKTVLVERYAALGGVCLNVGCIPSKALLHVAVVTEEAQQLAEHGVSFGAPKFDLDKLRAWKSKVVGKLTGGLMQMAKARKVEVVRGVGRFLDAHHVEVVLTSGDGRQAGDGKKSCALPRRSSPPARRR